jgi:hypothetical protein
MAARFARLRANAGRPIVIRTVAVGAAATVATLYVQRQQKLRLDAARDSDPVLKAPPLSWVPPSRDEMLQALKKGSMLDKKYEPSEELARARDVKIPDIGTGDEGYDLLVSDVLPVAQRQPWRHCASRGHHQLTRLDAT